MQDDNEPEYEVGYRKPPKTKQWQPGQSGNPSGKRKPRKESFTTDLMAALAETVQVTIDGKVMEVTVKELIVQQLIEQSAHGNKRAYKMQTWLRQQVEEKGDIEPRVIDIPADVAAVW